MALHSLRESWGSGVGRALMDRAQADITALGKRRVFLWVFQENRRARRFYEKCGFLPGGECHGERFGDAVETRYEQQL